LDGFREMDDTFLDFPNESLDFPREKLLDVAADAGRLIRFVEQFFLAATATKISFFGRTKGFNGGKQELSFSFISSAFPVQIART
jgi:hypothetical protein